MAAIPGKKSATPFTPTVADNGDPTTCFCCGMRAVGIGISNASDPQYLCKRCLVAIDDYKKIRRLDDYELKALDGGVDAIGDWIAEHGVTDLAHFDELMQRMLVKHAWEGCASRLRKLISEGEAPF